MSYADYDVHDPLQRQMLLERIEADQAESRAQIERLQAQRDAGLGVRTWQRPEPEPRPEPAPVRQRDDSHEWAAYVERAVETRATALAKGAGTAIATKIEELREEIADVIVEEVASLERKLRTEFAAQIKGLLAGLRMAQAESKADDPVLDMTKAFKREGSRHHA